MRVRTVDVAGTSLCVRSWGEPDGIPFVFWHWLSFGGNGSFLDVATPALVEAGFAPVALDGPGFGDSAPVDRDGYAVDRLADLLWALIDATVERRPLVLAGHSWGGAIAITAAARRPDDVAALALLDSGHVDYADWSGANPNATVEELVAELEAEFPATWDELVSILTRDDLAQTWTLDAWANSFAVDEVRNAAAEGVPGDDCRLTDRAHGGAGERSLADRRGGGNPDPRAARDRARIDPRAERGGRRADARRLPGVELRPVEGMRHAVFADLGAAVGVLIADWLRGAGIGFRPGN